MPRGEWSCAGARGSPFHRWKAIILRRRCDPVLNYFTDVMKNSTLLSAIGVADLPLQAYVAARATTGISNSDVRRLPVLVLITPSASLSASWSSVCGRGRDNERSVLRRRAAGNELQRGPCRSSHAARWWNFGRFRALDGVSMDVRREMLCASLDRPGPASRRSSRPERAGRFHDGEVNIDGIGLPGGRRELAMIRRKVGFVFQSFNLFPHMTVRQNVTWAPVTALKMPRQAADERAAQLLERVGIISQIDKYPQQLSGGQQQRVAIVRALAMSPQVMLFDEPTSALDPEMIKEVLEVIRELALSGMTMIVVTHEMGFAREVANRIVFFDHGRLIVDAAPATFFDQPEDERLVKFLAKIIPRPPTHESASNTLCT